MKLIYVKEATHKRIKALALRDNRSMVAWLDILLEAEMSKINPAERNELYARLDEPGTIEQRSK